MDWVKTRVLGKGSHGTVFLAVSTSPDTKPIAIKIAHLRRHLLESLGKEEVIMEWLHGCPEILQCYGKQITIEGDKKICNHLLEYALYGTLLDHIIAKKFSPENEVRNYTHMILKGLSFMHQEEIVHCDLKPENILLFPSSQEGIYQLKILDFGLSKTCVEEFDLEFWRLKFRGTPYYMSPESIEYGLIESPLDIWSLGCIIEMITGFSAWWTPPDLATLIYKFIIEKAVPKFPSEVSQDCPDFLSKCFLRNPKERWTADMP